MGTWGTWPTDNDGSHDKWHDIESSVQPQLVRLSRRQLVTSRGTTFHAQMAWERIGVLFHALEQLGHAPCGLIRAAMDDLKTCMADIAWVSDWRSPAALKRSAKKVDRALRALLPAHGRCTVGHRRRRRGEKAPPCVGDCDRYAAAGGHWKKGLRVVHERVPTKTRGVVMVKRILEDVDTGKRTRPRAHRRR